MWAGRLHDALASLLDTPPAPAATAVVAASYVRAGGTAELTRSDLLIVLSALREAADFTTTNRAVAYRALSGRLGDDR